MGNDLLNQQVGSKLSEVSINTILNLVVRHKQAMIVKKLPDVNRNYVVNWNSFHAEPEIIEPGTTSVRIRGIVQVVHWLEEQEQVVDWYTV